MLALASLLFALADPTKTASPAPLRATCPVVPATVYPNGPRLCPALEISGRIDASGLRLDPVFDVYVPPAEFARAERGDASLTGYGADGKPLFVLPFTASGSFHIYVPLGSPYATALQRLRLATASGAVDRTSRPAAEPVAEAIAVDDKHFVFAWDASVFPAVRIAALPGTPPLAYGSGTGTYEQLNVESPARRVSVDFSDGVRSITRSVRVFGR